MKRLLLLRHAKSGWDEPVARDFDRPLNAKGRRGARRMGLHMREAGVAFDHVIASPAVRAVETLDELWESYGHKVETALDKRVYLASAEALIDVVQEAPDSADAVLLCGHNPGMEDMILALVPEIDAEPLRAEVEEKYPTASLAEIEFAIPRWADMREGGGHFARFTRPRDLDPTLGPDEID